MEKDFKQFQRVLLDTLEKADTAGYKGYSKFDGLMSELTQALSFGLWPLRLGWTQLVMRFPVNVRPFLLIRKGINPEAMALFARANLSCMEMGMSGPFAERAQRCLDWLLFHDASASNDDYHGKCWGYNHPWQSPGFYQAPNYPNCYVTCIVAGALVHGYHVLKQNKYLDAARSTVDFILNDLPVFHEDDKEKSIAYVPTMRTQLQVININALAGATMAQVGSITDENNLLEQASKLMMFVARNQTSYDAWYYTLQPEQSLVDHDNYHTGMILDALLAYEKATGDLRYKQNYERGLAYYGSNLFLPDGAPKWTSSHIWPKDVHGSSQGVLTFSLAGDLAMASRIARWALVRFYKGDGDFSYQRNRFISKQFTLLHWCNGWMARGLAALMFAWHCNQDQRAT